MSTITSFDPTLFQDVLFPPSAEPVICESHQGESCYIAIGQPDSEHIQIYEHTDGPVTLSVYESPWHAARITAAAEDVCEYFSSPSTSNAISDLALFFLLDDDQRFPEFLDFLDDNYIPYRFESETVHSRVPAQPGAT